MVYMCVFQKKEEQIDTKGSTSQVQTLLLDIYVYTMVVLSYKAKGARIPPKGLEKNILFR